MSINCVVIMHALVHDLCTTLLYLCIPYD